MHHDVVVVGGSFAGLSAATYLLRGRRRVAVVDSGRPRNRFAHASNGFLSRDGVPPQHILAEARQQMARYAGLEAIAGEAVAAEAVEGGFAVTLRGGARVQGTKLILAFGLRDRLPDIPGAQERWGRSVLHCPYCHGVEFDGGPIGILYNGPETLMKAGFFGQWGSVTLYLNGRPMPGAAELAQLAAAGVIMEPAVIAGLEGAGEALSAIRLQDGRSRAAVALYLAPQSSLGCDLAERLGCAVDETGLGPVIRTDAERMTTVPGVYAAGDIARVPHAVAWAVADGVTAGTAVHRALVFG